MSPSLRYTYDFVHGALPDDCQRVLEIGCGTGELAKLLQDDGFEMVAIDSDSEAVEQARDRGVDARLLEWPSNIEPVFDSVLFTRSLHHIHDLDQAVDSAEAALKAGGRIIVEDFRAEGGSERSSSWFLGLVDHLVEQGRLNRDSRAEALEQAAPSRAADHLLHSSTEIGEAIGRIGTVRERDAAYYFRYLEPLVADTATAGQILEAELAAIEQGRIDALGKRFVVTRL